MRENEYLSAMVSVSEESRYGSLFRRALGGCRSVSKLKCIVVRRASQLPNSRHGQLRVGRDLSLGASA